MSFYKNRNLVLILVTDRQRQMEAMDSNIKKQTKTNKKINRVTDGNRHISDRWNQQIQLRLEYALSVT